MTQVEAIEKMHIRNSRIVVLLFSACSLFLSCETEEEFLSNDKIYLKQAILNWEGDYSYDGCGFFIEFDNKTYKPENEKIIGKEFKSNEQMLVLMEFKFLDEPVSYVCGDFYRTKQIDGIKIISIKLILKD